MLLLGFSWHPTDEEKYDKVYIYKISGIKYQTIELKSSLNCSHVCVHKLTARGLDMRSKDCRMRLAVALVTPQG